MPLKSSLDRRKADACALIVLCACCWIFLRGIRTFYPLDIGDESDYLLAGVLGHSWQNLDWGPLYSSFYGFLSRFFPDRMDLFYANLAIEVSGVTLLHYLLSRRMGVRPIFSLVGAFFVLISGSNAPNLIKIHLFNLGCFYVLLYLTSFIRSEAKSVASLCLLSLGLIYVRQDNIEISLALQAYLLWLLWRQRLPLADRAKQIGVALLGFCAVFSGLTRFVGNPFNNHRVWLPFSEYYFWDHANEIGHGAPMTVAEVTEKVFGGARSLPQAFMANPAAFLHHVGSNAFRFLSSELPGSLMLHFPLSSHALLSFNNVSAWESALLFSALTLPLVLSAIQHKRLLLRPAAHPYLRKIFIVFVAACLLESTILNSLLEHDDRYSAMFVLSFFLLLFSLFDSVIVEIPRPVQAAVCALLLLVCPNQDHPELFAQFAERNLGNPASNPVGKISTYLGSLPGAEHLKVFGSPTLEVYTPRITRFFHPHQYYDTPELYKSGLAHLLKTEEFDVIVVSLNFFLNVEIYGHPGDAKIMHEFLSRPEYAKVMQVGSNEVYVAIRHARP